MRDALNAAFPQRSIIRMQLLMLFWICAFGVCASLAEAQATRDFSKVQIRTIKLADNFYVFDFDGTGAAISVLTGPDGVLMVDDQFAPLAPRIEAEIGKLSSQPIRYVINTHQHGDHTGGNEYFGRRGATIVANEQVLARMARSRPAANGQPVSSPPAASLPTLTFDADMWLNLNGEDVQLIAVPRAHTDGDTLVYFPRLDILAAGDLFRAVPYPHIDLAGGGTLQGFIDGMGLIIGIAGPNTRIISGHAPIADRAAVIAQRDLVLKVRDRVAALMAQGKSEEEVVAAKVTEGLDPRVPQSDITVDRFVREVYSDLKAAR